MLHEGGHHIDQAHDDADAYDEADDEQGGQFADEADGDADDANYAADQADDGHHHDADHHHDAGHHHDADHHHDAEPGDSHGFPRLIFFGVSGRVPCLVSLTSVAI